MRNATFAYLLIFASVFALTSSSVLAAPVKKCDDLATAPFGADVKIESAKLVAAANNLPEHCDVRGVIWPEAKFTVKLPTDWNNRFQMAGNGGWAGTISLAAVDAAVRRGYAATSTDTGHDAQKEAGATFAYPGPNNPNAARKVIDFGYLAVHETALLAKKMIRAYYGSDPLYSYWVGWLHWRPAGIDGGAAVPGGFRRLRCRSAGSVLDRPADEVNLDLSVGGKRSGRDQE